MYFSGLFSQLLRAGSLPLVKYNAWLSKSPLVAKSLSSGFIYGIGDICAQFAENYSGQRTHPLSSPARKKIDWKRVCVFVVFGTVVAG